jgi:membrane-associated phospholipid phosphatase
LTINPVGLTLSPRQGKSAFMFDLTKPWPLGLDRRNWPWALAAFAFLLACLALIDVWASRGAVGWPESWRAPFFFITDYGLSDWVLIPSLLVLILARLLMFALRGLWRRAAGEIAMVSAFIFIGVGLPGLVTNLLKRLIGRGRPTEFDTSGAFSFQNIVNDWTFQSFPSGHSATAIAMAFVIGFLWPRLFWPFLVIGLVVAFSRVPVGMHYPSDVLAGVVVGMLGAYFVRNAFASRSWLFVRDAGAARIIRQPLTALPALFSGRGRSDPGLPPDRP